jgi:Leucine-rich repeat (LRR) protein
LRTISLDNNKFTELPPVLKSFKKLYSLTCKNNQINLIEESFFDFLPNLETLALDNNKLERLPESMEKLVRLKMLTFDGNALLNRLEWLQMIKNLVKAD